MVMLAADTVGLMQGAVKLAVEHAAGRIQFGVPIGGFQAVQHLIAEAHVDAEGGADSSTTPPGRSTTDRCRRRPRPLTSPRPTAPAQARRCARRRSRCTGAWA